MYMFHSHYKNMNLINLICEQFMEKVNPVPPVEKSRSCFLGVKTIDNEMVEFIRRSGHSNI